MGRTQKEVVIHCKETKFNCMEDSRHKTDAISIHILTCEYIHDKQVTRHALSIYTTNRLQDTYTALWVNM